MKVTIYSGNSFQAIVTIAPGFPGGFFGRAISSAGDFNGDGFIDLIVGASSAAGAGKALVIGGGL
ncbi:MAG: integrin alpha [bacterium]|nr:integrin alpha [bacterium]